jgi:hypothetical protein
LPGPLVLRGHPLNHWCWGVFAVEGKGVVVQIGWIDLGGSQHALQHASSKVLLSVRGFCRGLDVQHTPPTLVQFVVEDTLQVVVVVVVVVCMCVCVWGGLSDRNSTIRGGGSMVQQRVPLQDDRTQAVAFGSRTPNFISYV